MTKRKVLPTAEERLMQNVQKIDGGCWLWLGKIAPNGYGVFSIRKMQIRGAHRAAYRLFKGEIPPEKPFVIHSCDVRHCVNPEHLSAGTYRDNINDMLARDRSLTGERHAEHKLTEAQVLEIKRRWIPRKPRERKGMKKGQHLPNSSGALAEEFNVCPALIKHIGRGHAWKHLNRQ